jgi:uncharacterized protein (DUF2141 family)
MNGSKQAFLRSRIALCLSFAVGTCLSFASSAGELTVNVTGLIAPYGSVGCSLFSAEAGFPMDNSRAETEWVPVSGDSVTCRFKEVLPGKFAVSVAHDVNGNRKVDTNFFGLPTEQWGVSNNVRPSLRAPRFNEAVFNIASETPNPSIDIKVAK